MLFVNNVQDILLQKEKLLEMDFPAIWRPKFQKYLRW